MNSSTDGRIGASAASAGRWPSAALLFEDFDDCPSPSGGLAPSEAPPPLTVADVAAAREAAYREGHEAALREIGARRSEAVGQAMAAIAAALREADQVAVALVEKRADEVANLLMAILDKLFPQLWARHGAGEAAGVVRTILPFIPHIPAMRIRANPDTLPELQQELAQLEAVDYGRMEFVPTAHIMAGDLLVEWQDGSAVRDGTEMWRRIKQLLVDCRVLTPAQKDEAP
jgi:flagellar biosynthesis/type III secretory pathway protein FliH